MPTLTLARLLYVRRIDLILGNLATSHATFGVVPFQLIIQNRNAKITCLKALSSAVATQFAVGEQAFNNCSFYQFYCCIRAFVQSGHEVWIAGLLIAVHRG